MVPFPPRPLKTAEREVLERILSVEFPGATELRLQVPVTNAVAACECGCASIDLAVEPQRAPAANCSSPLPVDTDISNQTDPIGGIMVFTADGDLSVLEIFSYDDPIAEWPNATELVPQARTEPAGRISTHEPRGRPRPA